MAQYATDSGQGKVASDATDQCLRAIEDLNSLLLHALRKDPTASVESMKSKIRLAVGALDSLLQTVPSTILDKGKAIADVYRISWIVNSAMLLLDAFSKDRATIVNPLQNPQLAPFPALPPPDPCTQEMINENLKKAEELGEKGMIDEAQKALEEAEALKMLGAHQEPASDGAKVTAANV